MLGGQPIAEIEAALSDAMTNSLYVPSAERAAFVANHLVRCAEGASSSSAPPLPKPPTEKPPNLDEEIAELNDLVRDAVNCAARHADQPLRRIADHLLRQDVTTRAGIELPGDEPPQDAPPSEPPSPERTASAAAAAATAAAAPAVPGNALLAKVLANRKLGDAAKPTFGKTPSAILPSVIGAFEEKAAERMAKEVDESLIEQAMMAGEKTEGMQEEESSKP